MLKDVIERDYDYADKSKDFSMMAWVRQAYILHIGGYEG